MQNIDPNSISVEDIMKQIQIEVGTLDPATLKQQQMVYEKNLQENKLYNFARRVARYLQRKGLYKFVNFVRDNINLSKTNYTYILDDFLKFQDEDFINNAYQLILNRPVDKDAKTYYLSKLRNGEMSKTDIILTLHYSKEGKMQNVVILGSKKRFLKMLLFKLPVLGYLSKLVFSIITLPRLLNKINTYEHTQAKQEITLNNMLQKQQELDTIQKQTIQKQQELDATQKQTIQKQQELDATQKQTTQKQQELEKHLNTKASTKDLEILQQQLNSISYLKNHLEISQTNLQNLINEVKTKLPAKPLNTQDLSKILEEEDSMLDPFYVSFEDKFRGSREEIKEKSAFYLPYIENLPFKKEDIKLLDVGCGRGEWLELLKEQGYKAKGIDLNRVMVDISKELNLDVQIYDVLKYLKSLKSDSLSAITGFHIIEHLPFNILIQMYDESLRVLKSGGIVIFETPNPQNLIIGSCNFYTDPTHINPIPPHTAEFTLQQRGFKNVQIQYIKTPPKVNIQDPALNDFYNSWINKHPDYSIIGQKA